MVKLSTLAEQMTGSEIVKLGNEIAEQKRQGAKIYNYTIGDFDPSIFPIPKELEELIIKSYAEHTTNYPPAEGIADLRRSVSSFINKNYGLDYSLNEIQISCGGRPLIYTIFKTLVDEGDKVIYAVPSWNNNHYTNLVKANHCVIETTPEHDFMPLPANIAANIADAALVCLCTPQNPTGTTLSEEALSKICDIIIEENESRNPGEKKVYLLFDQIYGMLTYGDTVHYNPVSINPKMKEYTVFVDGISKMLAATGLRVGWSMGPAEVIAKMKAILSHMGGWAPMAEQNAVAKYLQNDEAIKRFLSGFKEQLQLRLTRIYDGLQQLKSKGFPVDAISPQAAIYLTVKFDLLQSSNGKLNNQEEVTSYLLQEAKLAIVPFYAFGANRESPWYRMSVGTCKLEEIDEMLGQLEAALTKLN